MNVSVMAPNAMAVTPHHLATQTAIMILRQGGTAIEAMVAAAATIAVVYPHMNSVGGDSFWLIVPPSGEPVAIDASGPAGSLADINFFQGMQKIPEKGIKSAITVAGTVAGWEAALNYLTEFGYKRLPIAQLLSDAIRYAEHGFPLSSSQALTNDVFKTMLTNFTQEFKDVFFPDGKVLKTGDMLYQKKLAYTLKKLAKDGLDSFYRGKVAQLILKDIEALGMPITESDLFNYHAMRCKPLRYKHTHGELYNLPPPTQGLLSLAILGMLDDLHIDGKEEGEFIHATIEATKQSFKLGDKYITDPKYMTVSAQSLLSKRNINEMVSHIDLKKASSEENGDGPGDTIWMGIMDKEGFSVSFIQSIFHEYGSGILLPKTGILWQDRGWSFSLEPGSIRALVPGKKPFHTLNPAAALLNDGRIMVYGSRGGAGQPQFQTAVFHRYAVQKKNLQQSIFEPRWAYESLPSAHRNLLRLENRFSRETIAYLRDKGHNMTIIPPFSETMGQAGALVRHTNGLLEGAWDIRSNGFAAGF